MVLLLLIAALACGVLGFVLRRVGHPLEGDWVNGGGLVLLLIAILIFLGDSGPPRGGRPREPGEGDFGPFDYS
ncbi:MAG: hypothetical protein ACJ8AO_16385 [Gemmatimonadaceae bacterium]